MYSPPKPYGCANLLLDVFLLIITGGWWVIWIIIREWRKSRVS